VHKNRRAEDVSISAKIIYGVNALVTSRQEYKDPYQADLF